MFHLLLFALVIPKVLEMVAPQGKIVALVKPQFEVGKGKVGKVEWYETQRFTPRSWLVSGCRLKNGMWK